MSLLAKSIITSVAIVLTACGNNTEAPTNAPIETLEKTDQSADVRASMPSNASPFDVHLAALKQITDDMNAINTMGDALKLKKRIAANVLAMNSSLEEYTAQTKGNKRAEINAFQTRQKEYTTTMENYMKAMQTLGEKDPKLFGIVAMELAKVAKAKPK